jgi:class 3 adenylate cyclase
MPRQYDSVVGRLTNAERAALPDRAFAYIDSAGRRRLPIYDAAHVRNALARFEQVAFESTAARERARSRLLAAAKRYRIVPIGFIDRQLQSERERATGLDLLPTGFLTMLLSDIEGSTGHLARLGDDYGDVLDMVRAVQSEVIERCGGRVVEARADDLFAVFTAPVAAVSAAATAQRALAEVLAGGDPVRVRMGVHAGYPTRRSGNYVGMAVHTAARVSAAAHGGQVVLTGDTVTAIGGPLPDGLDLRPLGAHRLRGIPGEPMSLHQVRGAGLLDAFPPLRC